MRGAGSGLGQGVGVWEAVRGVGSAYLRQLPKLTSKSLWQQLLGGDGDREALCTAPPAGTRPTAPIGRSSQPMGTAKQALGVGAAYGDPLA